MLKRLQAKITPARLVVFTAAGVVVLGLLSGFGKRAYHQAGYWTDLLRNESCVGCHIDLHPMMIQEWKDSAHFLAGVGCEGCHGEDHALMMGENGEVSAEMCAGKCHVKAYAEFKRSKHSAPRTGAKADLLKVTTDEVGGCTFAIGCHAVRKTFQDGSRGKCSVCHPSHGFSMEAARDPDVCVTCHSGSLYTEVTEYDKSIHGILYRTVGLEGGGATCVTCHMPGGTHDDGFNLTDIVLQPGDGPLHFVRTMPQEEFDHKRAAMMDICKECHGAKLAKQALREGDEFRKKGAYMLEEAAVIVRALYDEGLLDPMPANRLANPFSGPVLILGPNQLFDREMSAAERIFYNMYMFTYNAAWRKAYHNLPALIRWHENEMLKDDLIMLRAEASKLRALARAGGLQPRNPGTAKAGGAEPQAALVKK